MEDYGDGVEIEVTKKEGKPSVPGSADGGDPGMNAEEVAEELRETGIEIEPS